MRRLLAAALVISMALPVAGCAGHKEDSGMVVGGILGGILGSQVGKGHGKTAAIIGGVLIGGYIGKKIGKHMDRSDEMRAQQVLEKNRTGQTSTWQNPDTKAKVAMTPTKTYRSSDGNNCREFQTEVTVKEKKETIKGTACRRSDGTWEVVN